MGFAQAPGGDTLRNVPTCEIADAPGILTAMRRALVPELSCAWAACHTASPPEAVIPAAKAIVLDKLRMSFRMWIGLLTNSRAGRLDAGPAACVATTGGNRQLPAVIFGFGTALYPIIAKLPPVIEIPSSSPVVVT